MSESGNMNVLWLCRDIHVYALWTLREQNEAFRSEYMFVELNCSKIVYTHFSWRRNIIYLLNRFMIRMKRTKGHSSPKWWPVLSYILKNELMLIKFPWWPFYFDRLWVAPVFLFPNPRKPFDLKYKLRYITTLKWISSQLSQCRTNITDSWHGS